VFFVVVTAVALLGTLFGRTFLRFKAAAGREMSGRATATMPEYAGWLGDRGRDLLETDVPKRALALYRSRVLPRYPAWRQWAFAALAMSFAVCAGTGFVFAVILSRGMFGLFLLAHVMAGGLFAVSLTAVLLLRAGAYGPGAGAGPDEDCVACPVLKNVPRRHVLAALFWAFAAAGFVLIATALLSMLPYFHFGAQIPLLEAHKYGALAALLAALLMIDIDFIPRRG
jgi:hypothetical protein